MSGDAQPQVLDLFKEFFEVYKKDFAPFVLGGLGIVLVTVPLSIALVFAVYFGIFLGMVPGMVMEDEAVMMLGLLASTIGTTLLLVAGITLVVTPLQASFTRAVDAHLAGGEQLSIGSAFTRATEGLVPVLIFALLHTAIGTVLVMMCYIPGILYYAVTDFAWCHVVLDKKSPIEAIQMSIAHAVEHINWHIGYIAVTFGIVLIVSYLPFVGFLLAPGVITGWRVYVYRKAIAPAGAVG